MSIARTLALALATAALVAPTAQGMPAGMPERPVNAPGATAVDSASISEQLHRYKSASGDVRLRRAPSRGPVVRSAGGEPWQSAVLVTAAVALVAATTARLLRRDRATV
jgi:hypothetical protein